MVPSSILTLYRMASTASAYLVAIPNTAVIHIQKAAPGPPMAIAVATPAILPLPTVAESAVIRAWKGLMSPSPPLSGLAFPTAPESTIREAFPKFRSCTKPVRTVRRRPVPKRRITIGAPHSQSETPCVSATKFSISGSIGSPRLEPGLWPGSFFEGCRSPCSVTRGRCGPSIRT